MKQAETINPGLRRMSCTGLYVVAFPSVADGMQRRPDFGRLQYLAAFFSLIPLSAPSALSSEAGERYVFKSFYLLTFKRFEPPFSFPSNGSNAPFKGAR
jgi:hypothetical protein